MAGAVAGARSCALSIVHESCLSCWTLMNRTAEALEFTACAYSCMRSRQTGLRHSAGREAPAAVLDARDPSGSFSATPDMSAGYTLSHWG